MTGRAFHSGVALLTLTLVSSHADAQTSSEYVRFATGELHKGHLTTARRLALEAVFNAEYWEGQKTIPVCGEWRGTDTVQYVAFLPGDALKVMVVKESAINYYDLSAGRVERRWRANLALPGDARYQSLTPSNPVSKQFAKPTGGRLRVVQSCGTQPNIPGIMTQFVYSAPPGQLTAGQLTPSGDFLVRKSFQTNVDMPEKIYLGLKLRYYQWLTDQP